MAWADVTYSCGHTGEVQIYGARKDREKAVWVYKNYKLCPDCYEEQRRKEEQAVLSRAKEYGFPELSGSPKQIAWAMRLRDDFIKRFEELVEKDRGLMQETGTPEEIAKFEQNVLSLRTFFVSQTESRFWIDCREKRVESVVREALKSIRDKEKNESPRGLDATEESTVYPENQTTKDVAEINESDGRGLDATEESTVYPENQTTKDVAEINESDGKVELKSAKKAQIDKTKLVQVQRIVSRAGKTFLQNFWVKPSQIKPADRVINGQQNLLPASGSVPAPAPGVFDKAYFDTLVSDKSKALEYLKSCGITWNEHSHTGINWMRAMQAVKAMSSKGTTQSTPSQAIGTIDQDTLDELKQYKTGKEKVVFLKKKLGQDGCMKFAKLLGVTWDEHTHKGINIMRMSMALQKHLDSNGSISVPTGTGDVGAPIGNQNAKKRQS